MNMGKTFCYIEYTGYRLFAAKYAKLAKVITHNVFFALFAYFAAKYFSFTFSVLCGKYI